MIIPDVNLLLYANIDSGPQHAIARPWFEALLNGETQVGLAPVALTGFIRLSTNRRIFTSPLEVADAVARVRQWSGRSKVQLLTQDEEVVRATLELILEAGAAGNLTTDAQLAAHALVSRATIASADGDFSRFPRVKVVNPLRAARSRPG
jgi:toxin-antitoxin system PIN domain toxin